jgi:hypothetical protein
LEKSAETNAGPDLMPRLLAALALALAVFAFGCGSEGGGADSGQEALGPADQAYADRADAICARALTETRRLAREFSHATEVAPDPLALTTEGLVKPGIAIRERLASRLRALAKPQQGEASVTAYIELFDPLEALSQQRLQVGREGDLDEAQRFEKLMRDLAIEQQDAARKAGLHTCATDFVGAAFARGSSN